MEKTWQILLSEWLVWRFSGNGMKRDTFYGDFMAKVKWTFPGAFMAKPW